MALLGSKSNKGIKIKSSRHVRAVNRGVQIPGTRSPGQQRRLICLGPHYGTSCDPSCAKNFEVAPRLLKNLWNVAVTPSLPVVVQILLSHQSLK